MFFTLLLMSVSVATPLRPQMVISGRLGKVMKQAAMGLGPEASEAPIVNVGLKMEQIGMPSDFWLLHPEYLR